MITFSVIIPNYNHAAYLAERIESVVSQTYPHFELIILDDCSTDNSREIIESYKKYPVISHVNFNEQNNGSPFLQWIKGVELAKNEWIWIAESDDFADSAFLQEAAKAIQLDDSIGLFYCDGIILKNNSKSVPKKFSEQKNQVFNTKKWTHSYCQEGVTELNDCLKFDNTVNNVSGVVFKKELFIKAAEKLKAFKYYGDWYLYIQLCLAAGIYYCNLPLNFYRNHSESLLNASTSSLVSRREYFMILQSLCYSDAVKNKRKLIDHFCFHYLNLGFFSHSLSNSFRIITKYFRLDRHLALKIIPRLMLMKVSRKRHKRKILQIEYTE